MPTAQTIARVRRIRPRVFISIYFLSFIVSILYHKTLFLSIGCLDVLRLNRERAQVRPARLSLANFNVSVDCGKSNDGDADSDNGSESDSHK